MIIVAMAMAAAIGQARLLSRQLPILERTDPAGRLADGFKPLLKRGKFPLRIQPFS
jgi:hypothetical protein